MPLGITVWGGLRGVLVISQEGRWMISPAAMRFTTCSSSRRILGAAEAAAAAAAGAAAMAVLLAARGLWEYRGQCSRASPADDASEVVAHASVRSPAGAVDGAGLHLVARVTGSASAMHI